MKFKERLLQGTLVKRYKRFFIDIKYKSKTITAHCPNSGSMMGLLNKGNKILKESKIKYIEASTLEDAANKAVTALKKLKN